MKLVAQHRGLTWLLGATGGVLVAACGGPSSLVEMGVTPRQVALTSENGRSPNGRSVNGRSPNGTNLNGLYVSAIGLSTARRNGLEIPGLTLSATVFTETSDGQKPQPAALDGVIFAATLTDGSTLPVRIDGHATLDGPNAGVDVYAASYQTMSGWMPLCGNEPDGSPTMGIPLNGKFDYGTGTSGGGRFQVDDGAFMLACRHFAAAKCVEMGYKPWLSVGGTPLADYLQTCTRVLRADYCGDGTSYTVDGTLINLYDNVGLQFDTEGWRAEAEWGPGGAICVGPATYARFKNTSSTPPCYASLVTATCGQGFGKDSLMIDEYYKN